jgi:prolyl oligopeptidase
MTSAANARTANGRLVYPPTRRDGVVDDYHGTSVPDPYRWLEDLSSPATREWVESQNAVTFRYLESLPLRDAFRRRITELWDYPKVGLPWYEGGRIWYFRNSGLQRQAVLYSRPSLAGAATMVMDPNAMSPDGSISLAQAVPSPDGKWLAYALSEGGADWQTVHVRDLATGTDAPDVVRWVRFSGISWTHDGQGFFYSRFPVPPAGQQLEAALGIHSLYYHRLGTDQSTDRLVFERPDMPNWFVNGHVTEDGRHLFIIFSHGTDPRNRLYHVDLGDPGQPRVTSPVVPIRETDDAAYSPLGTVDSTLYLATDLDAPRRRVVAIDLDDPAVSKWRTVIPESRHPIESLVLTGGAIAVQYLVDVQSRLSLFGLDGRNLGAVALPAVGTVGGLSGRNDQRELYYAFTSPLYPSTVFAHDRSKATSTPFEAAKPVFDPTGYETREFFAVSKDGTRVPYFVTSRKGLALNGSHPTLLYAYGGFNISITPAYRSDVPAWLERGGVYVTASLRGGGEYGEDWHQAALFGKKQNAFDDFIAVAEDLIRRGYTSPAKLAIQGGSNGGLLVTAVANQRPDLFAVVLPAVGVMDMLRYDRFTGGAAWAVEYGASSDPAMFPILMAYSPVHNIRPGTCYPATLVTTADHDDRVVPSHSFKYIATLQAAQGCGKPVLIRIETKASHGYRPTDKRIAELADEWAFTAANTETPNGREAGEGKREE